MPEERAVNPSQSGVDARAAAAALVEGALARRGGIDEALAGPAMAGLEPRDRGFARALAMATLRALRPIDAAIDARVQKPPPEAVRTLLRIGAAQLWRLDTPAHAAVAATVDLAARQNATRPFKGLINAVLRRLAETAPPDVALVPDWILSRWSAAYGPEADAVAALMAAEPATDLTLRDPAEAVALAEALEAIALPGGTLRTNPRGDVAAWPGCAEGRWWVQDASAAVPARLLAGRTALDLCAAPGGKTLQLAAAGFEVVALDRSAARLERVKENLARTGLTADAVVADALAWDDPRTFDAVLLDAPCTATGTFRRHPESLFALSPRDVAKLSQAQAKLLDAAAGRVAAGGSLVYCVCSLEPEEGEGQVPGFLARHPDFSLQPIAPGEGGSPEASLLPDGTLRILPSHVADGTDGFFMARFVRA
jgi:16S rRNA (cytosine967-C5)-methyltransferase